MEPSSSSAGGEPKKKRAPLACSRCKSRKKRCDAELNPAGCSSCLTAGVECRFIDPITQKEASRGYVRKLEEKIAALELALVAQGVPTLDHLDGASPALVDAHNARVEQSGTGDDDLGLGLLSLGATAEEGAAAPTAARVQPLQHFSLAAFFASEVKRPRGRSSAASPCAFPPSRCLSDLPNASVKLWLEAFIALSFAQFPLFDATFLRSLISRHRSLESSLPFHPHNRTVAVHLSVTYLVVAIGAASSGNCAVAAALRNSAVNLLATVSEQHDLHLVQISLLFTIYSLFSEDGPAPVPMNSLSIRLCTELGLHSAATYSGRDRSATFWTAYSVDRTLAHALGRPLSIDPQDVCLPPPGLGEAFDIRLALYKLQETSMQSPIPLPHLAVQLADLFSSFPAGDGGIALVAVPAS